MRASQRKRGERNRVYMYVCVCDFLVMLLLPIGGKRATLTDGREKYNKPEEKFIIVSRRENCPPFVYSFHTDYVCSFTSLAGFEECENTRSYLFTVQH